MKSAPKPMGSPLEELPLIEGSQIPTLDHHALPDISQAERTAPGWDPMPVGCPYDHGSESLAEYETLWHTLFGHGEQGLGSDSLQTLKVNNSLEEEEDDEDDEDEIILLKLGGGSGGGDDGGGDDNDGGGNGNARRDFDEGPPDAGSAGNVGGTSGGGSSDSWDTFFSSGGYLYALGLAANFRLWLLLHMLQDSMVPSAAKGQGMEPIHLLIMVTS
jgi:hypothetical protein